MRAAAWWAAAAGLLVLGCTRWEATRLEPGGELEGRLVKGEVHRFTVELAAGDYLEAEVGQGGVDVVVRWLDPGGRELLEVDSPNNGTRGREVLRGVASHSGAFRLALEGASGGGSYTLRTERRKASDRDRAVARAAALGAAGDEPAGQEDVARLEEVLALWQGLGEAREQAIAHYRLGWRLQRRDPEAARRHLEASLALLPAFGGRAQEVHGLTALGTLVWRLEGPVPALVLLERALDLAREIDEPWGEATARNNIARIRRSQGRIQEALDAYDASLALYRRLGEERSTAVVLTNLGLLFTYLNRLDEARERFDEALDVARALAEPRFQGSLLGHLGWLRFRAGDHPGALALYDEALGRFAEAGGDPWREGVVHDRRGTALLALGRPREARAAYGAALGLVRQAGSEVDEAHVLTNLARLELTEGDLDRADRLSDDALERFRAQGERTGEAGALFVEAQVERRRGRLAGARERLETLLGIVESLREATSNEALRLEYFASRQKPYELYTDLLVELAETEGADPWVDLALVSTERRRARELLDLLLETGAGPEEHPAPPARLEDLLDGETVALVYALGDERSFLWRVTSDDLDVYLLPERARIEELSRRFHELLVASRNERRRNQLELTGTELAEMVLGPLAGRLDRPRLVVLADGALHYVPFAALPLPGGGGRLLDRHEVVHLPSAAVLAALRRRPPRPVNGELAVVADPVFAPGDERLDGRTPAVARPGDERYARLVFSRREADAVLATVPEAARFAAFGFAARRELVLDGSLDGYRIVHFATHAEVDSEHPELSSLVLSRFAADGRPVVGELTLSEVYRSRLSAELVVLSACRTALGREVRGEGLIGLSRGFMRAGASQVVMSLWSIDDEASARLMELFYRGVVDDGLSPPAALAAAQRTLAAGPRWSEPFYWAPFVFQGDWLSSR